MTISRQDAAGRTQNAGSSAPFRFLNTWNNEHRITNDEADEYRVQSTKYESPRIEN
jgi:hypothetical protein